MNSLAQTLKHALLSFGEAFSSLTVMIALLLTLSIGAMAAIIWLVMRSVKKAKRPRLPLPLQSVVPKVQSFEEEDDLPPPRGGWLGTLLSRKGFYKINALSLSFLNALRFLEKSLGRYNSRYRLPWYLLVGTQDAGKSTFMENLSDAYEAELDEFEDAALKDRQECRFWFLKDGVVLDVRGDLLVKSEGVLAKENAWRTLTLLLKRYRPAKPLNGIVLTIPATELYGKTQKTKEELMDRAQFMAKKLALLQQTFALRLPVYIVLSKCDTLPGFQSLCGQIPGEFEKQMLGWSNPYAASKVFSPSWIEEGFETLIDQLRAIQMDVFVTRALKENQDGLFIFPTELKTLKDSLSIYLSTLFKGGTYEESLLFRGFYLAGDSGMVPLQNPTGRTDLQAFARLDPPSNSYTPLTLPPLPSAFKGRPHIAFIHDLFKEKIFREQGLSKPLDKTLSTVNRNLNMAKLGTAVFIGITSYGLFQANDRLDRSRARLVPLLLKIQSVFEELNRVKLDQPEEKNHFLDVYTRELMVTMANLDQTSFFSIFVPPSWFTSLRRDLYDALKKSYQETILRSLYMDLLLKSRDLLNKRPQARSESLAYLLNPLKSAEFHEVKDYVHDLAQLQENIHKFNSLRFTANLKDLNDLVKYTFQTELPKQLWEHQERFSEFLKEQSFPLIDLKPYTGLARQTLHKLYKHFLNAVLGTKTTPSLLGDVREILTLLESVKNRQTFDLEKLRQLSLDLGSFSLEPGNWMDGAYFTPGRDYDVFLSSVDQNPFLGRSETQILVDQTAIAFYNFTTALNSLDKRLLSKPARPGDKSPNSQGLFDLQKSLKLLFNEPYMAPVAPASFATNLPQGHVMHWDPYLVQSASEMVQKYEDFLNQNTRSLSVVVRENIGNVARSNLQSHIRSLLGRAQSITRLQEVGEGLAAEESLRSQIQDVKQSTPFFLKLLELMSEGPAAASFLDLRDLLGSIGFSLLEKVDDLLKNLDMFLGSRNFSWWDGRPGAGVIAYGVKDLEDLKTYVSLQRDQIEKLSQDFAKPLVDLLSSPMLGEYKGDRFLLSKWRRIVEQLSKHRRNSLLELETFILESLNTWNYKTVLEQLDLKKVQAQTGDFFKQVLHRLQKAWLARAEILKRYRSLLAYKDLSRYFNQYIKGRFPFVEGLPKDTANEVDPEVLREFFQKYDHYGKTAKEILDQVYQLNLPDTQEMFKFLKQMEKVRKFLGHYVGHAPSLETPTFDILTLFRVSRDREKGGGLIVDWDLKTDGASVSKHDKPKTIRWTFGAPIEVSFRWPDAAPDAPMKDRTQPWLQVEDKKVNFNFGGKWSLLWLLRAHLADQGEFKPANDPYGLVLKFSMQLQSGQRATVFNQVTIGPPAKSRGVFRGVHIPDFPVVAPPLSEDVLVYQNQPVLSEGTLNKDREPLIVGPSKEKSNQGQPDWIEPSNFQERLENMPQEDPGNVSKPFVLTPIRADYPSNDEEGQAQENPERGEQNTENDRNREQKQNNPQAPAANNQENEQQQNSQLPQQNNNRVQGPQTPASLNPPNQTQNQANANNPTTPQQGLLQTQVDSKPGTLVSPGPASSPVPGQTVTQSAPVIQAPTVVSSAR